MFIDEFKEIDKSGSGKFDTLMLHDFRHENALDFRVPQDVENELIFELILAIDSNDEIGGNHDDMVSEDEYLAYMYT